MGSRHVSYHAGQRTFIMLHAHAQTVVKDEFSYSTVATKPKMFQSFVFTFKAIPSNATFPGNFGLHKEGTLSCISKHRRKGLMASFIVTDFH